MVTWKRLVCLGAAVLVLAVGVVACAPQERDLSPDEAEAVRRELEPMVENLLAGLQSGDYAVFSRDFDGQMKNAIPESGLADMTAQLDGTLGAYISREFVKAEEVRIFTALLYDARFEDEEHVTIRVVFREKGGVWLVTGLWFDSPKLRELQEESGE